jgi:Zn-dependent protease with chaperone function
VNFFKHQDAARSNTTKLVIFFLLAVLSLIVLTNLLVMIVFGYADTQTFTAESVKYQFDWNVFFLVGVAVMCTVALGSLYKIISLSGGGARVAEMMDAELVVDGSGDINKQKILNVVEEMAIASGTPVPPVYLLNEEGINAFAAGYSPSDAIIGITRGAIEELSRDQLQGVVAHEFSHILNGDMRLNIRLIGILHGILLIGLIGYYLLRSTSRSRSSKNGGGIVALGLGLMIIGYAGTFFGNLIKAAVSRQREYLADASAVQFTRNPDGIAGALKRIGGASAGSMLNNPGSAEISHALFSEGVSTYLNSMLATHPPLAKRIRNIQPNWDGKFDYSSPALKSQAGDSSIDKEIDSTKKTAAVMTTIAATLNNNLITDQVGQPTEKHLDYAHQLITEMPAILKNAAHEPFAARALIYFLILDKKEGFRKKQLHHLLTSSNPGVYKETIKLVNKVPDVKPEYRLPLVDMALSTLRQLSKKQYFLFKDNLVELIKIDSKINLLEWSIQKIVLGHLDYIFSKRPAKKHRFRSLEQVKNSCAILLSLLIHADKKQGLDTQAAFNTANEELGKLDIQLIEGKDISLSQLNDALDELARLKPLKKPQLLKACAVCITTDLQITPTEAELFRAIADTLDCPVPPLLPQN